MSNKVVIIDEFHAYDAYMMEILDTVLNWLRALHVPVIILSATLLEQTRKDIFSIFSEDAIAQIGYPRITCAENGHVYAYPCNAAKERTYRIEALQYEDMPDKIVSSVRTGGNTLYIGNTVQKAWQVCQMLRQRLPKDVIIRFYTGRTTPENKKDIGDDLVYLYGKEGKKDRKRPQKTVVVATQIMEMSVDVDFDTVFSELAPADALFQRMGRMARHGNNGTVREQGFESIFFLVIPKKQKKWFMPYEESVLNGTEKVFLNYSTIHVPRDITTLLERAYQEAGEDWKIKAMALASLGSDKVINSPDAAYEPDSGDYFVSADQTRNQSYQTETIICVPDGEQIQDTREWAKNAILKWSVTIPKNISDQLEIYPVPIGTDGPIDKTVWLRNYKIIRNQDTFWEPDKQFIFGLSSDVWR